MTAPDALRRQAEDLAIKLSLLDGHAPADWAVTLILSFARVLLRTAGDGDLAKKNQELGQLLAHIHRHLANGDKLDAQEFEIDLRTVNEGIWIDTETLLQQERIECERLRALVPDGWNRDMSKAPRDGTRILVQNDRGFFAVEWLVTDDRSKPNYCGQAPYDGWMIDNGKRDVTPLRGSRPFSFMIPAPPTEAGHEK